MKSLQLLVVKIVSLVIVSGALAFLLNSCELELPQIFNASRLVAMTLPFEDREQNSGDYDLADDDDEEEFLKEWLAIANMMEPQLAASANTAQESSSENSVLSREDNKLSGEEWVRWNVERALYISRFKGVVLNAEGEIVSRDIATAPYNSAPAGMFQFNPVSVGVIPLESVQLDQPRLSHSIAQHRLRLN